MADESIVIEVKDSVASSISAKLKDLAKDARDGYKAVNDLQKGLNGLNSGKLSAVSKDANSAAAAISKVQLANQNLATAEQKTAAAVAATASAQSKAAAAAASVAAANSKAAAAADQATLAALRLQQAQDRIAASAVKAAAAQQAAADKAKAAAEAQIAAAQAAAQASALAAANAATAQARLAAGLDKSKKATDAYVMSDKQRAFAMRGVPAQITDIVVSLQGGQKPLTVLMQQGGQLKDMFGGIVPAVKALGASLLAMISPVTILAAVFAGFAIAVGMVESKMRDVNAVVAQFKATGRDIDGTKIVDLTKELAKLPGISKSAATEIIGAFAAVRTVGGPILEQATKLTGDLAVALGTDTTKAADKLAKALDDPLKGAIALDKELGFLTVQNFKTIDSLMKAGKTAEAQKVLVDLLSGSIKGLAEDAMTPMQKATDKLGNAWNDFIGEMNNSSPIQAATNALIGLINILTTLLEKLNGLSSIEIPDWVKWAGEKVANIANPFSGVMGLLSNQGAKTVAASGSSRITGNNNIKTRTGKQYGMTTEQKTDAAGITHKKSDKSEETRATALSKINLQLDNQLKLQQMLGPERDKQEQFDRINESLIGRKIKLTDEETASIKAKISAIVDNQKVEAAMNRIYDDVLGPQKEFYATEAAGQKLLDEGIIDRVEYNKQMVKAAEVYANIKDPMREFNKNLDDQLKLSKTRGEQTAIEQQLQNLQNDLLTKGITLRGDEIEKIRERLKLVQDSNIAQAAENALLDDSVNKRTALSRQFDAINSLSKNKASGFNSGDKAEATNKALQGMGLDTSGLEVAAAANVSVYENMYAKIDEARQKDLISEQDAASLRTQIWIKSQEAQITQAQGFFTSLTGLASSNNKKLATIGKAAAISNAIIDTYKSATGAYAAMSSIPYVGPALGAAAAAAAVAAGMANVQAIRSQGVTGYIEGGYTGNIPRTAVAGEVHGQEFVHTAQTTSRVGVDNMQALQDGTASVVRNSEGVGAGGGGAAAGGASGGAAPVSNIRVVNVLDPSMVGDYLATPEGEQVFMNVVRKNAQGVKQTIQNG